MRRSKKRRSRDIVLGMLAGLAGGAILLVVLEQLNRNHFEVKFDSPDVRTFDLYEYLRYRYSKAKLLFDEQRKTSQP